MTPLRAAQVVALGRVAYGLACMAAPRAATGPAGQRAEGPMVWLARTLGVRDLVLGAGTLAALAADPRRGAGWVAAGAAADALDVANAVAFRRELDTAGLVGVGVLAVPATAAGVWAARALRG